LLSVSKICRKKRGGETKVWLPFPFLQDTGRIDLDSFCPVEFEKPFVFHLGTERYILFSCKRLQLFLLRCPVSGLLFGKTLDEIGIVYPVSVYGAKNGSHGFASSSLSADGGYI